MMMKLRGLIVLLPVFLMIGCNQPAGEPEDAQEEALSDAPSAAEGEGIGGDPVPPVVASPAHGDEVYAEPGQVGCRAEPLAGLTWVKGEPVTSFKPGNIYVVEFWATWCGPCLASIPHLSELQNQYRDKNVTIIGISNETRAKVDPFVEEKGKDMDYTVALDPNNYAGKNYMDAFNQGGIPHSFVVDGTGRIVWHGHPRVGLDEVLEKLLAGEFDALAHARAQAEARAAAEEARRQAEAEFQRGMDEVNAAIAQDPENSELLVKRAEIWLGDSFSTDLSYRPDRLPKALADYRAALALDAADPLGLADDIAFLDAWSIVDGDRSLALEKFAEDYPESIRRPFALYDGYYRARQDERFEDARALLGEMLKTCMPGRFRDYIEQSIADLDQKLAAK